MITFTATVMRKQDDLPRYVIVSPDDVPEGAENAFQAVVSLNDGPPFLRNVRPWGKTSRAFFFNLTADQCRSSDVDTGDAVKVRITPHG